MNPASIDAPQPAARNEPGLHPRTILVICLVPIAVMLFALFAFKPLYLMWCKASGTQMNPNNPTAAIQHSGRMVKVFFETTIYDGLPLRFWCDQASSDVEVGADGTNLYHFHN
nr:cytochrome c oxidase assembly protein [Planctomycetota bacterium]